MAKDTFFPPHQEKLGSRQVIHDKMRKSEGEKPEKEVEEKGLRPEPEPGHSSLLHVSAEGPQTMLGACTG